MSGTSADIARILPYLRRYARAIIGSQPGGDACVRAALERMLDADRVPRGAALRIALYREVARGCRDLEPPPEPPATVADAAIVDQRVRELPLDRRQALLLSVLEGFTLDQVGEILQVTTAAAESLFAAAKRDLRDQRPTRILIIEDEPIIALDLAGIVARNGHTVVGIATTAAEAVAMAEQESPGLILADIQLADRSSGIDAVRQIRDQMKMPVIFITAFPERLLTGEGPEPTFLITKPFDADTLNVSISQALATARR
ncbi:MAG: response regulator [Geminicoccaceae bacterium]